MHSQRLTSDYSETKNMKNEIKTITPSIAKKMLANNSINRPVNERHVERLSKEILSGRWKVNGDTIRISLTGRLLDGQHRLSAIVKSNMTVQTWVLEGVEDDIFDTIDTGKIRSKSDTLTCLGEVNATRLSAALILIDKYVTGRSERNIIYSNGEVQGLLEEYPEVRNCLKGKRFGIAMPSVVDACNYLFSRKDPKMAVIFMERVLRGEGIMDGDPEYALRERLVANSISKSKLNKVHIFALFIKAWNHARSGKRIQQLKLHVRDGKLVEFPVIQ